MTLTEQQFREMFPNGGSRLDAYWPYIQPALSEGLINTPLRMAAFLAQLAHESAEFLYAEEIADGSAYEGREDLGNTEPGDGVRFKGRGPIQITGRANYKACGAFLGLPLLKQPDMLLDPEYGMLAASWFWREAKPWLNPAADLGWFKVTTRLINGSLNGWNDRVAHYNLNLAHFYLLPYSEEREDSSIRDFQTKHGLTVDGDVGSRTLAALLEKSNV